MNLFVPLEVIKYMLYAGYCGEISNQSLYKLYIIVYKLSSSPNLRFQTFVTVDKVCELQLFNCKQVPISHDQQKIVANGLKLVSKPSIF